MVIKDTVFLASLLLIALTAKMLGSRIHLIDELFWNMIYSYAILGTTL